MIDAREILIARNRDKITHKMFTYEAILNHLESVSKYLQAQCGGRVSLSDANNAILCWFFRKCKKDMPYIKEIDNRKINILNRVITTRT